MRLFTTAQREGFIASGHDPIKVLRWGLALVFGGYKQGKSRLENPIDGAMCCVGVLCNITPGVDREVLTDQFSVSGYAVAFTAPVNAEGFRERGTGFIEPVHILGGEPDFVADMAYESYPDFAAANDERDATFRQIGLWLLSTVPTLFFNKLRFGDRY